MNQHSRYMSYSRIIFSSFIVLIWSSCQSPESPASNEYEEFINELVERGQLNGNVLVYESGNIVHQSAHGIANPATGEKLHLNSVFRLASVSKQFTAMAIVLLKEEGKLDYDQDIRDFIPELPYQGITIRHLIHHVSGLPDYINLLFDHWKPDLSADDPNRLIEGNEDMIRLLAEHQPPVHFESQEEWEYSNTGYALLASIVSRVSGMPFEDFMKERIFEKANMKNTVVYEYTPDPDPEMPNRVFGFRLDLNGKDMISSDSHFLNGAQGDGGIYSTLEDLLNWDRALHTDKIVNQAVLNEVYTPIILNNGDTTNYAFGVGVHESKSGKKIIAHSGGWVGFLTYLHREIEDDHCIVILTNHFNPYFDGIRKGLLDILHGEPYTLPPLSIRTTIGSTVVNKGIDAAIEQYHSIKTSGPDDYRFHESELNSLGYQLLREEYTDEACSIFELNMKEYPESANTYDSYGDGLLSRGDTTNALVQFKKAIAIDSSFTSPREKIQELEGG